MLSRALPVAAGAALLLALAGCGSGGSDDSASDSAPAASTSASASSGAASASSSASSSSGAGQCTYATDPSGASKKVSPPPSTPTVKGQVKATIDTSVGALHMTLDAAKAPCTVNSFVSLAKQGFYDQTSCHRLGAIPGFEMLQCGDPTGTGTGGPGYTVPDEYDGTEKYPAGTLAMANTGQPNSGGSQFFMVYGKTQLDPAYTVFGKLDAASIKTLEKVGAAGTDNSEAQGVGKPKEKVTFTKVTID